MRYIKFFILLVAMLQLTGCGVSVCGEEKIHRAIDEYVSPTLNPGEQCDLIGVYHRRDTVIDDAQRVIMGVIYNIKPADGTSTCHDREALMTADCRTVLNIHDHDTSLKETVINGIIKRMGGDKK